MSPVQHGLVLPSWVSGEVLTSTCCGLFQRTHFEGTTRVEGSQAPPGGSLGQKLGVGAHESQWDWDRGHSSLTSSDVSLQASSSG